MDINKLRFLVVDDHPVMRGAAREYLEGMGVEASAIGEAEDGAIALRRLRTKAFNVVITDVSMPSMDGIALLKAIKSDDSLKHLPVLMASTEGDDSLVDLTMLMGAVGYLVKPYTKEEFEDAVRKIVGNA